MLSFSDRFDKSRETWAPILSALGLGQEVLAILPSLFPPEPGFQPLESMHWELVAGISKNQVKMVAAKDHFNPPDDPEKLRVNRLLDAPTSSVWWSQPRQL